MMDLSAFEAARRTPAPTPVSTEPPSAADSFDFSAFEAARAAPAPAKSTPRAATAPVPAPREPDTIASRAAPSTIGNVASAIDMAWSLLPQISGVIVEAGSRLAYRNEPKKIRDAAAAMDKQRFVETFDRPVGKLMKMFGFGDVYSESDIERVMRAIGKAVEKGGDKIETATGGSVSKEDVLATVDAVTAGLGMAGAKFTLGKYEKKTAPTAQFEARPPAPILDRLNALEARLGRKVSTPADLRKAEAELEADAFRDQVEGIPTALRTGEGARSVKDPRRKPVSDSGVMGVRAPDSPRIDPALGLGETAPGGRQVQRQSAVRFDALGRPIPSETPAAPRIDPMLAAGEGGRSVADPKRAVGDSGLEGVKPAQRKQMLYGLAAGGAAAAFVASYGEFDNETAAGLAAAGALIALPGREPLKIETIRAMPDATPLGAILDRSPYTLSTLEMLPKNRFEFSKQQVEQLLKRQEVTKAEQEVLTQALAAAPGETITAKQLMQGVKEATGDFELKRVETNNFADYGLSSIGRADKFDGAFDEVRDPAVFDTAEARLSFDGRLWEIYDADGDYITNLMRDNTLPDEAAAVARARAENQKMVEGPATATTTIYQSPVVLGDGNHFGDPNYFAHTRSFIEGGVRHVVELQSDVAQKARTTLTPEARRELQLEAEKVQATFDSLREIGGVWASGKATLAQIRDAFTPELRKEVHALTQNEGPMYAQIAPEDLLRRGRRAAEVARVRLNELNSKLEVGSDVKPVRPMLKDWHKRLVREEVSRAASEFEARRSEQAAYLAEKQRELASAEADLRQQSIPKIWASAMIKKVEDAAYDLRVMAMDLRKGHVSEGTVRQYMLKQEELLPPEARQEWREYFENNADETEGFLRPGKGEEGEWGGDYASNFPRVMAEFLEASLGRPSWAKSLQEHVDYLKEQVATAEKQTTNPVIRFATADTVAKVEGWPEESTTYTAKMYGRQDVWERDYALQAPRILREYESRLRREASNDAEKLAAVPRQIETAKNSMEVAKKAGHLFENPEHANIYARYAGDITKFLKQLGGKEAADSKDHTWIEVPLEPKKGGAPLTRTQMFGIGAVAAGAGLLSLLTEEEQSAAAPIAAMALFAQSRAPSVRSAARRSIETAESVLGNLSTSIRNISEAMLRPVRKHELDVLKNTYDRLKTTTPFVERLKSMPREKREAIASALFSGKPGEVIPTIKALDPNLLPELVKVRKVLSDLGSGLVEVGKLKGLRPEYFPRIVVDYEGLLKYLGSEGGASALEKRIYAAERQALSKTGDSITPLDRSAIISEWLSQQMRGPGRSGFLKNRSIEQVTREMLPFYAPADEALILYVRAATAEIERAKFFGKHLIRDAETNKVNVKASIHNIVEEKLRNKEVSIDELERLKDLLWARFGPGEQGMSGFVEDLKNLGYAALLAQPTSAIVQFGDVATVVYAHGLLSTIKSVGQTLTGRGRMTTADFGLIDNISAETASTTGTARFVNRVFKASGFNLVDRFGKSTAINAALDKYGKLARSDKGVQSIQKKYGEYFGDDLGSLVSDLRAGRRSSLVDELIFSELSDIQPVSRVEMPKKYLEMRNGRALYMLKSFMLKQADIVRRDVGNEWKRGNKLAATNKALRFSLALGIGGASTEFIRNWLLGRDDELEWSDVPANMLKTFMLSEFVLDQPNWEKRLEALGKSVLPPVGITSDIVGTGELTLNWLKGEAEIEDGNAKAVRYIPIVGVGLYHDAFPFQRDLGMEFGGAERANRLREQRRAREERKELLGE